MCMCVHVYVYVYVYVCAFVCTCVCLSAENKQTLLTVIKNISHNVVTYQECWLRCGNCTIGISHTNVVSK